MYAGCYTHRHALTVFPRFYNHQPKWYKGGSKKSNILVINGAIFKIRSAFSIATN